MPVTALIYQSEVDRLGAFVAASPNRETGGELWGHHTRSGVPVVCLVTGPGRRARHFRTSFFQDEAALDATAARLFARHALFQVGNWHSHHSLGLLEPSEGDDATVFRSLPKLGWPTFLLGLGNIEARGRLSVGFYTYDAGTGRRLETAAQVLPGNSPHARLAATLPASPPPAKTSRGCSVRPPRRSWHEGRGVAARLARELRALKHFAALGLAVAMRLESEDIVVTTTPRGGDTLEWRLSAGFPGVAPRVTSGVRPVALAWQPRRLIVEHLDALSGGIATGVSTSKGRS